MKKVKRILSIDWDYFIKATALQRGTLFPDGGNENISYTLQDFIWGSRYSSCPELKDIGILLPDYYAVSHIILQFNSRIVDNFLATRNPDKCQMLVTVSHKWIYDFIMKRTEENEQFEVYNVDFHHDMYNLRNGDEEVNCGNWVNCLLEKRSNMKYFWIKREDSETKILGGKKVPCKFKKLKDIEDLSFDYVFLCRSDCWSPPHLDSYFERLWLEVRQMMPVGIENKVMTCRKVSVLSEIEEKYRTEIALARSMEKYPNATCANCGSIIPEGSSSIFCRICNKE